MDLWRAMDAKSLNAFNVEIGKHLKQKEIKGIGIEQIVVLKPRLYQLWGTWWTDWLYLPVSYIHKLLIPNFLSDWIIPPPGNHFSQHWTHLSLAPFFFNLISFTRLYFLCSEKYHMFSILCAATHVWKEVGYGTDFDSWQLCKLLISDVQYAFNLLLARNKIYSKIIESTIFYSASRFKI